MTRAFLFELECIIRLRALYFYAGKHISLLATRSQRLHASKCELIIYDDY